MHRQQSSSDSRDNTRQRAEPHVPLPRCGDACIHYCRDRILPMEHAWEDHLRGCARPNALVLRAVPAVHVRRAIRVDHTRRSAAATAGLPALSARARCGPHPHTEDPHLTLRAHHTTCSTLRYRACPLRWEGSRSGTRRSILPHAAQRRARRPPTWPRRTKGGGSTWPLSTSWRHCRDPEKPRSMFVATPIASTVRILTVPHHIGVRRPTRTVWQRVHSRRGGGWARLRLLDDLPEPEA
mmetsp:Transcript_17257/g.38734  ORF Transcript_17257/g.38734 Transcript_17257/m.38734 type:complete len:239 (+) Transcript_17257:421-1137(+)